MSRRGREVADDFDLYSAPGHLIRRAQQVHVELWGEQVESGITGAQFAVLCTLARHSPLDQTRLSALAGLDTSTCQGIVGRLQRRGLLCRTRDPDDGRRWLLTPTAAGSRVLSSTLPAVVRVGERLLEPLTEEESRALIRLMRKVLAGRALPYAADEVSGAGAR